MLRMVPLPSKARGGKDAGDRHPARPAGRGHGAWLFAETLKLAWRPGVRRVHVNTCTLDHPAALRAYLKAGFTAYKRAFESFPDPRLAGLLPSDAAPQIPLVAGGL